MLSTTKHSEADETSAQKISSLYLEIMSASEQRVTRLCKHHKLIAGYTRKNEVGLFSIIPLAIIYIILRYYGISTHLINKEKHSKTLIIPIKKTKIISSISIRTLSFHFKNIRFKSKIVIGLCNNIKQNISRANRNNTNDRLCIKKIHKDDSFSGILLGKTGHCVFQKSRCDFHSPFIIQEHHTLKISLKTCYIDYKFLYDQLLYEIKSEDFENQYMYFQKINKKKHISSPSEPLYKGCTDVQTKQKSNQYLCVQLFNEGDTICLTNMPKH